MLDLLAAALALVGLGIAYFENEYNYHGDYSESMSITLRTIVLILTAILDIVLYKRTREILNQKISKKGVPETTSILSTSLPLEILLNSVCSIPGVNVSFSGSMNSGDYEYSVNDIILLVMILRLYLIVRCYAYFSKWKTYKSSVSPMKLGVVTLLKFDYRKRPWVVFSLSFVLVCVFLGIAVKILERSFESPSISEGLEHLTNNEWLIIVTATTIGYGDFYPSTYFGRFFCLIACLVGLCLISLMIYSIEDLSEFTNNEKVAYFKIKLNRTEISVTTEAVNVIKRSFLLNENRDAMGKIINLLKLRYKSHEFFLASQKAKSLRMGIYELLIDIQYYHDRIYRNIKKVLENIPPFQPRLEALKVQQSDLMQKLESTWLQQKIVDKVLVRFS